VSYRRASTMPPASTSFVRPMTMPPVEILPDAEESTEDALGSLLPARSAVLTDLAAPLQEGPTIRGVPVRDLPESALGGHAGMFARPKGRDLVRRTGDYFDWYKARSGAGLWPYSRRFDGPLDPVAKTRAEDGFVQEGLNFASHDYLSLSTHPAVHEAAHRALRDYGPIASGSPILAGNSPMSRDLEEEVAKLLGLPHVLLFTTGWAAGFSAVTALVREHDHIVMDVYSHASLQQGAMSATRKISRFRHCDNVSAERQIRKARSADPDGGILVITETVFSMDSDSPRIAELQEICHRYDATLLVDCAHDLGCIGPGGAGRIGMENLVGKVDMMVGCFSKTFATNGGFFAARDPGVRQYVRAFGGPHLFSAAPTPVQTAVALEAMRISASPEGDRLRASMMEASVALRDELTSRGLECLGEPSSLVPVYLGDDAVARVTSAICFERRLLCNLIEYPAVAVGMCRVRLQMQSRHTVEHARTAARILHECLTEAIESGVGNQQNAESGAV
jgi:glycine C-acetyltransferase